MTKFDRLLTRIQKLPPERQAALADELGLLIDAEERGSVLTDEQWAEVDGALADENELSSSHENVFTRLKSSLRE